MITTTLLLVSLIEITLFLIRHRIRENRRSIHQARTRAANQIEFGPIPEAVKRQVWRRAGGQCEICGSIAGLQFDHKVPRKWGGTNTLSNIQLLCLPCHRDKTRAQASL